MLTYGHAYILHLVFLNIYIYIFIWDVSHITSSPSWLLCQLLHINYYYKDHTKNLSFLVLFSQSSNTYATPNTIMFANCILLSILYVNSKIILCFSYVNFFFFRITHIVCFYSKNKDCVYAKRKLECWKKVGANSLLVSLHLLSQITLNLCFWLLFLTFFFCKFTQFYYVNMYLHMCCITLHD